MTLALGLAELVKERVAGKAPIDDDQAVVGEFAPQVLRQRRFAPRIGPDRGGRHEVVAQCQQHHQAQLRIARGPAVAGARAAEGRAVRGRVRHAERGAIHPVHRQPAPPRGRGGRGGPHGGGTGEQRGKRGRPEPRAGPHDGPRRHRPADAAGPREHQIEMPDHLRDGAIAKQRHPDDEPHDVLRRQLAPADGGAAFCRHGLGNPLRINCGAERLETRTPLACPDRKERLPKPHAPPPEGIPSTQDLKRDPDPGTYALSHWHWSLPAAARR